MEKIKLKKVATKRVKEGYPLLVKGDFLSEPKLNDGSFVELVDDQKQFVARGYLATQNKGDGWVLTTNPKELLEQSFFEGLFLKAEKARNIEGNVENLLEKLKRCVVTPIIVQSI